MYYFIPNLSKYEATSVNLLLLFYWVHFLQHVCNLTLFCYARYKDEKHQMSRAKGKRSESSPLFFSWNSWFSYSVLSPPCYGSPGEGYILKSRVHQILFNNSPSENGLLWSLFCGKLQSCCWLLHPWMWKAWWKLVIFAVSLAMLPMSIPTLHQSSSCISLCA